MPSKHQVTYSLRKSWFQVDDCRFCSPLQKSFSSEEHSELKLLCSGNDWPKVAYWLEEKLGHFAFIWECGDRIVMIVDGLVCEPLYYFNEGPTLQIADDLRSYDLAADSISDYIRAEIVIAGFVSGSETLVPNVKQLRAGKCYVFQNVSDEWKLEVQDHTTFLPDRYAQEEISEEDCLKECTKVFEEVVNRTLARIGSRQIAIPLSGGLDSRALALLFHQAGKKNVLCYTYGKEGNSESGVSKIIANSLGYQWEFIPYTQEGWKQWEQNPKTREWIKQGLRSRSSVPHIQDVLAIEELFRRGVIDDDAVFIPGHILGTLAGVWTFELEDFKEPEKCFQATVKHLIERIYPDEFVAEFFPDLDLERFYASIGEKFRGMWPDWSLATVNAYMESWINWGERQAKFNATSAQNYVERGFSYAMPWCEGSVIRFWEKVPHKFRLHRNLCRVWLEERQGDLINVSPIQDSAMHKLRRVYRKRIPQRVRMIRHKINARTDYTHDQYQWNAVIPYKDYRRLHHGVLHLNNWLAYKYLDA